MSTILVDNLTGKTSAGDITVTSEGGAATMQLQQGLAKRGLLLMVQARLLLRTQVHQHFGRWNGRLQIKLNVCLV
jgi:hypothetical protein